jgi:carbon monoxide dehydrogenase subunit G
MDINGSYEFPAPPERVWDLLMDPGTIASCIPGCSSLQPEGENRYRAHLSIVMAAISGSYDGMVELSEVVPLSSYRLTVEGQGRPGFVKGTVTIALRPEAVGTIVDVNGTVQTGGPIARVGQRLIGGVAKTMQDRFFACMVGKV